MRRKFGQFLFFQRAKKNKNLFVLGSMECSSSGFDVQFVKRVQDAQKGATFCRSSSLYCFQLTFFYLDFEHRPALTCSEKPPNFSAACLCAGNFSFLNCFGLLSCKNHGGEVEIVSILRFLLFVNACIDKLHFMHHLKLQNEYKIFQANQCTFQSISFEIQL